MRTRYSFNLWLQQRRKLMDLTQSELGDQVGCSAVTVRKLEASERKPSRQLAEGLARVLRVPKRERDAFIQFARSTTNENEFQLPAWNADQPTWRENQLPPKPVNLYEQGSSTILNYDLITSEKPIFDTVEDGRTLVNVHASGDVRGGMEGRVQVDITQVLVPKPSDIGYPQALPSQIGAKFKVITGQDFLEGMYVGTMYPMMDANGNGSSRVVSTGQVISVSAGLVNYFLNYVFVEDEVQMVEGIGTGARGTMQLKQRR